MRVNCGIAALPWLCLLFGVVTASAEDAARTNELPAALQSLGVESDQIVSRAEASRIRGQMLDGSAVLAAAAAVEQRGQITELPGGVSFFGGVFFGDGLFINQNTGRGAIFDPDSPGNWLLTFSDLQGSYTVAREGDTIYFIGIP